MTYKRQKLLFLLLPTIVIGIWEFVRHDFEIPYLSHELGHVLGAVLVFLLTVPVLRSLFAKMEHYQQELNEAQLKQKVHQERENMARQLHDGIAQSLFFLSVKLEQIERQPNFTKTDHLDEVRRTVRHMHEDVRTVICHLMEDISTGADNERQISQLVHEICTESGMKTLFNWNLPTDALDARQYRELYACIREALTNVRKHADAKHVEIAADVVDMRWFVTISDDGKGFGDSTWNAVNCFGLKIMNERAEEMGWVLSLERIGQRTVLKIIGGEFKNGPSH